MIARWTWHGVRGLYEAPVLAEWKVALELLEVVALPLDAFLPFAPLLGAWALPTHRAGLHRTDGGV